MRMGFVISPHYLWIGAHWDKRYNRLYLLPIPCVGVFVEFNRLLK